MKPRNPAIILLCMFLACGATLHAAPPYARPNPWNIQLDPDPVVIDNIPSPAEIFIYTLSGRKVTSLQVAQGATSTTWNGTNAQGEPVSSGIYLILIKSPNTSNKLKLTVIR